MSPEYVKLLEAQLLELKTEKKLLQEKVESLEEMLFNQAGLLHQEQIHTTQDPIIAGKEPWYKRQKRLELAFRKEKEDASEV